MARMIVLEGPDLAGKSTLASRIQAQLVEDGSTAIVLHLGAPTDELPYELFCKYVTQVAYAAAMVRCDVNVVLDRLHVGECVYGEIMRDGSLLTRSQIKAIDDMLDGVGALKLYVTAATDTLLERLDERGDSYVSPPQLVAISDMYDEVMSPVDGDPLSLVGWNVALATDEVVL